MKWEVRIKNRNKRHLRRIKAIIEEYLKDNKQIDIAKKYNISRQRVSQIIFSYQQKEFDFLFINKDNLVEEFFKKGLSVPFLKTKSKGETHFIKYALAHKYQVFRNGFPDFLIRKKDKWIAIEVKDKKNQHLSLQQELIKKFFNSVGIEYKVFINGYGFEKSS